MSISSKLRIYVSTILEHARLLNLPFPTILFREDCGVMGRGHRYVSGLAPVTIAKSVRSVQQHPHW